MRILLLLDSYREDARGTIIYRLCQRWSPMREITLSSLAIGEGGPLQKMFGAIGVGTMVIPREKARNLKYLRAEGRRIFQQQDRPDIVQSHCHWPPIAARTFHNGEERIPFVSVHHDIRGFTPEEGLLRSAWNSYREKQTRKNVTAFVSNSRAMSHLLESLGIPRERTRRIPLGVDAVQCFPLSNNTKHRFRALMGIPEDCPLIVAQGPLIEENGFQDVVDAMPAVLEAIPRARLYIIGEGPMRQHLVERIRELALDGSVRLIGPITEILPKLYSTANVVVHPERTPSMPLDVAEAQAAGTPVVATEVGAIPELVRHEETGLLVPPASPPDIARAIRFVLEDEERREAMGDAARDFILETYEIGQTAEKYIELWKTLAPHALWQATDTVPIDDLEDIRHESEDINATE